jgi:hypothetical protein
MLGVVLHAPRGAPREELHLASSGCLLSAGAPDYPVHT